MSNNRKTYIYIIQYEDDTISVGRQADVESLISEYEEGSKDVDWKTIGKIVEPVTVDFASDRIEWLEETPSKGIVDRAILTIINYIR